MQCIHDQHAIKSFAGELAPSGIHVPVDNANSVALIPAEITESMGMAVTENPVAANSFRALPGQFRPKE